jgi:hypothetical protein
MFEVQGNGNVVSLERRVSSFVRLHLSAQGSVELIASDEEKVVIEADENLHDYFEIVNSGRTLFVTAEGKLRQPKFTDLKIRIYVRQLHTLYNASIGPVRMTNLFRTDQPFDIKIHAHGDTELNVEAPSIRLVTATHGHVTLRGACDSIDIRAGSHGDLDCRGLRAGTVSLRNASHGNITLYAEQSLAIRHMGHGYVHYYGPGRLTDVRQFGHGEIRHLDEPES